MKSSLLVSFAAAVVAFSSSAQAVVLWNETVSGDLSGDFALPTVLGSLGAGTHSIIGGDSGGTRDLFTITIPAGMTLVSVFNTAYSGSDGTAFIGIGSGTSIDSGNAPGSLLGYTHFGTGPGTVGTEIIDDIAVGSGSATFTPPLGTGTYTVWMQQAGSAATWQMDFVVVPEPGYASLLLLGLPWMARRRR